MRYEKSGITGKIVERELFSKSRFEELTGERGPEFKYQPFEQSVRMLKEMQPFDPTRPITEFAYMARRLIFKGLGFEDENKLRFYTAIGSPLDQFHSVDGWFEIDFNFNNEELKVTVDLKTYDQEYRADVVFEVPPEGLNRKVDKDQFIKYSSVLAREVIEIFKQKGLIVPERK